MLYFILLSNITLHLGTIGPLLISVAGDNNIITFVYLSHSKKLYHRLGIVCLFLDITT